MLEIVTFFCGMTIMIFELAGIRAFSPFFGSSHIIYTIIIGIIMASLSLGYWLGGKFSENRPSYLKLALIIFFAGIFILFLSLYQFSLLRYSFYWNLPLSLKVVFFSSGMHVVPSVLLGMVSPYIIQLALIKQENNNKNNVNKTGCIVGKFYAIATIGSICGTFLCGLYLIAILGIDRIFLFISLLLFIASSVCILEKLKLKSKIL